VGAKVILLESHRASPEQLRQLSDDELMRMAAAGLSAAYEEILRRYERPVRAYCARVLGAADAGDDAAQELFLEIWRTRDRYEARARFRSFLFSSARNHCTSLLRRRKVARTHARADDLATSIEQEPLDRVLAQERRRHLQSMVARLPAKLRETLWLRFSAELDYREIAEVLQRPEETIRSRVFLALRRLRALLDPPERS
jgi:RNA polymerase sigma-70 factor, ECF subfamily